MKSRELIRLIQEADPTGEEQCCIQNADVWHVSVEPAYYDGNLHVIDRDERGYPTRGRRVRTGVKINLEPLSISDALEDEEFVVEYLTEEDRKKYEHLDIERRRKDRQLNIDIDREAFVNWVFRKMQTIRPVATGWIVRMENAARAFYDEHKLGPDSPFIKVRQGKSFHDCREEYWEDTFFVNWDEYSRIIIELRQTQEPELKPERSYAAGELPESPQVAP